MEKFIFIGLLLAAVVSCTQADVRDFTTGGDVDSEGINSNEETKLPDLGAAPELQNDVWINTSEPIRISKMEDKVILLEMWTFG